MVSIGDKAMLRVEEPIGYPLNEASTGRFQVVQRFFVWRNEGFRCGSSCVCLLFRWSIAAGASLESRLAFDNKLSDGMRFQAGRRRGESWAAPLRDPSASFEYKEGFKRH